MKDEKLLTVGEAAMRLGLQQTTLRKWLLLRRVGYVKLGRSIRFPESVVESLISKGYRPPVGEERQ